MPGLLDDPSALDAAQPAPNADPNADPNAETVPDGEGEPATPEEQAAYDEFVKSSFDIMYGQGNKVDPAILKMLDDDPSDLMAVLGDAEELKNFSPVVALAATAAIVTIKVCEKTGEKDGAVILHGGKAILEDLAEVAGKAGIKDYSEEEMGQAFHMGADLFRHAAEEKGLVDTEQAKQEWGEIETADKEGRLGDVIPQLRGAQQEEQQPMGGGNEP